MKISNLMIMNAERRESRNDRIIMIINSINILLLIAATAYFVWMLSSGNDDIKYRAAYCDGYYGVDNDTAIDLAIEGHGKSISEVIDE